jgi:hypothetical protein
MYERVVDVPRLVAELPDHDPGHPVLTEAAAGLSRHYGCALTRVSLAYYRDGRDSVAWHGDRLGYLVDDTVVAILSVGAPRRFLLRPAAGGASRAFDLGWGDLLVMGGSCQRTWQHAVPKVARAGPRISVQFRPAGQWVGGSPARSLIPSPALDDPLRSGRATRSVGRGEAGKGGASTTDPKLTSP